MIVAIEFLSLKPKDHFGAFTNVRASIGLIFVDYTEIYLLYDNSGMNLILSPL
jgi:hypothetical protein